MNLPNCLSLIRLMLVPCFAVVYLSAIENASLYAGIIFFVAAATDIVDGYLARKWNQITKIGRVLDPLADKLLQLTALTCFMVKGIVPVYLCCVFLAKEFLMLLGGLLMVNRLDDVIPSNIFGKIVSFMVSVVICAAIFFKTLADRHVPWLFPVLFGVLAMLTVIALVIYFVNFVGCLRKKDIPLNEKGLLEHKHKIPQEMAE